MRWTPAVVSGFPQRRASRVGWLWLALLLLALGLCQPLQGLTEFKLGRFQEIPLIGNTWFEAALWNIPENATFVTVQAHTQYVNTTLSLQIPARGASAVGLDPGLLLSLKPRESMFVWHLQALAQNASAMSIILPYNARDPVPGGCSSESNLTSDPNLHLKYNLYEATLSFAPAGTGYARGAALPFCDMVVKGSRRQLQYDIYQYFLPEGDLSEKVLFTSLQKMAEVKKIEAHGVKLFSLGAQDETRVTLSSIRGQGVIYNVVVKDPVYNTSAAYTLVHTYGCSFTDHLDNCYTLRSKWTRIFFAVVGLLGLFICFFGHRYLKTEFFFMGFIILGCVSFILLVRTSSLGYDVVLTLTASLGHVGGVLLVACWWLSGSVIFSMLFVGLVLGFLFSSTIAFTPMGKIEVFQDDTVFWVSVSSLALIMPFLFYNCPRVLNITACGLVGSYTVVLGIHTYVYTSLAYITLNILKRALDDNFKAAYTNVPFQRNDYILMAMWLILAVSGMAFQFTREKDRPVFPPHPYRTWRHDRQRRETNILDPSHHTPPLQDRVRNALTTFKQFFVRPQSMGEQTPLLL
ncbi:transmembrane 7 superfamily member 3 isoform X2 [Narcine bancroftii]|uniref:transmembrane 7 superfamily member 3 isoform X2 n=1 Tax=Narcine bancroftii TaxID=1343680 RepID=UPI0038321F93